MKRETEGEKSEGVNAAKSAARRHKRGGAARGGASWRGVRRRARHARARQRGAARWRAYQDSAADSARAHARASRVGISGISAAAARA
jgi:hypothetical protein